MLFTDLPIIIFIGSNEKSRSHKSLLWKIIINVEMVLLLEINAQNPCGIAVSLFDNGIHSKVIHSSSIHSLNLKNLARFQSKAFFVRFQPRLHYAHLFSCVCVCARKICQNDSVKFSKHQDSKHPKIFSEFIYIHSFIDCCCWHIHRYVTHMGWLNGWKKKTFWRYFNSRFA